MSRAVHQTQPSVLKTTWPAFVALLSLVAVAVGFVEFHHSLQDYRFDAAAYGAPPAQR